MIEPKFIKEDFIDVTSIEDIIKENKKVILEVLKDFNLINAGINNLNKNDDIIYNYLSKMKLKKKVELISLIKIVESNEEQLEEAIKKRDDKWYSKE